MRTSILLAAALVTAAAPIASADPDPTTHVLHVPPGSAAAGAPIQIVAVIDTPAAEPTLEVRWRRAGTAAWTDAPFERSSAGGWYATLPADAAVAPGVEYYIVGTDLGGAEHVHFASAAAPQPIAVTPDLTLRLEDQARVRTRDLADSVAVDLDGHDFGNRYGHDDYYARAELTWTHRFLRVLDTASFGMGGISGRTPEAGGADAADQHHAARYGFAAARLRLAPSLFVDARAILGVSQEGFLRGVAGAVTFGKPWRSNLSVGGEALDALGASAYVRLQWDTAAPFLMGAAIVRTDLPGALVGADGLFIRYDVAVPLADRITLRAAVSYGARDGAAHLGGGLGTQVDF